MTVKEINFDGIVGPTHHFGGLGIGNVASQAHQGHVANPMAAALQGLDKMKLLHSLGCLQAVLPPHPRPDFGLLRGCGFTGTDEEIVREASKHEPRLLSAAYSASSMWTANAATVSRGASGDLKTHFTPANLVSSLHRSIEPAFTTRVLREIFSDEEQFAVHQPLPNAYALRDEGAANHMRISDSSSENVWEVFVYGETTAADTHPSRQSLATCRAIARRHGLASERTIFLQQHPDAIAAGAFHNDVVATSCENVLLHHESAFTGASAALKRLEDDYHRATGEDFCRITVKSEELSLDDAVASYLFNSQIIRPHGNANEPMTLVCPGQCKDHPTASRVIEAIIRDSSNPIEAVCYVELGQSMNNGGGPACLRLRVPVNAEQVKSIKQSVLWNEQLDADLRSWITDYYPSRLTLEDLGDPKLLAQIQATMLELGRILKLDALTESGSK